MNDLPRQWHKLDPLSCVESSLFPVFIAIIQLTSNVSTTFLGKRVSLSKMIARFDPGTVSQMYSNKPTLDTNDLC